MAFNDYNPVNSGLLQGFSLAHLMQRAAIEKNQIEMAKQREARFSNESSFADQMRLADLGAKEVPPGTDLSAQLQAAPTGEVDEGGGQVTAPAAPLDQQLLNYNGKRYAIPGRETRNKQALDRKIQEIKATETAKEDLRSQAAEKSMVTLAPEVAKTLGLPAGARIPPEHQNHYMWAYVTKLNADAKNKENPIVHSTPPITDDQGNVSVVHTYKDKTSMVDSLGAIGRKTQPRATPLPRSTVAEDRAKRQETVDSLASQALTAAGGDAEKAEEIVAQEAAKPGAGNPYRKHQLEIKTALRPLRKPRSANQITPEERARFTNSGKVADPRTGPPKAGATPTAAPTAGNTWDAYKKRIGMTK